MENLFEDQITLFLDFLGFSEFSKLPNDPRSMKAFILLKAISALSGDFRDNSKPDPTGPGIIDIQPTITTFSDHIVASYPINRISAWDDKSTALSLVLIDITTTVAKIAAAALRAGFLIRGGVSLGQLHHSTGVVFGPAMIEAYELESKSAIYPRVIVSASIKEYWDSLPPKAFLPVQIDFDGMYSINYFQLLLMVNSPLGEQHNAETLKWFNDATSILRTNLSTLQQTNRSAYYKWVWFARQFSTALRSTNPIILSANGVNLDDLSFVP